MKEKELEELYKEERNRRSIELFDLPESELSLDEVSVLDKYMYDLANTKWRILYINDKITHYEVSNTGLIRNTESGKFIKSFPDKQGYGRVSIFLNGKQITLKVHRLVATAFIPNPENKPQVNHIYPKHYNKKNKCNWVGNLEWVTSKENVNHSIENGLTINRAKGERIGTSIYKESQIRKACELLEDSTKSYKTISKESGISYDVIAKIATGDLWNDVSKDYKIPKRMFTGTRRFSDEQIHEVCRLLSDGFKPTIVKQMTGISLPLISSIRHRTRYVNISERYAF